MAPPSPGQQTDRLPVSTAKRGFSPRQARDMLLRCSVGEVLRGEDLSLWAFTNWSKIAPVTAISRHGPVMELETRLRPEIGSVRATTEFGDLSLDEVLASPDSFVQGFIVIHAGRIAYEGYPGMNPRDNHVSASTAKILPALVVGLLEEDGKIDVNRSYGDYVPELRDTAWESVRIIDGLDMSTGLDTIENDETRSDPTSIAVRLIHAALQQKNASGVLETARDLLRAARRVSAPGQAFEYGSLATVSLVVLAEAVAGKPWDDIFEERVWSKMGVEGDLQVTVDREGLPMAFGMAALRLRDLARFGMLFTPSWSKAARERIVSGGMLRKIQRGGRPALHYKGVHGDANAAWLQDRPICNSRHWDAVFEDGDLFKFGAFSQGLYVSPSRDLVIAHYAALAPYHLVAYPRAIAKSQLFNA